jgi:SAM-dependent methyltransferase
MANVSPSYYFEKKPEYFAHVRLEIVPYLPQRCEAAFEVGCAEGATLRFLKDTGRAKWIGGIELIASAGHAARPHLDWFQLGDIEASDIKLPNRRVDLLLLLDVLEHLVDPWATLSRLRRNLLAPGGVVVIVLPNVRNWRVVGSLVFRGKWSYSETGVLDRTHLRFFTQTSGVELLRQAGLKNVRATPLLPARAAKAHSAIRFLRLDGFLSSQVLFRGEAE